MLGLYFLMDSTFGHALLWCVIGVSSIVALEVGVYLHRPKFPWVWHLFAASVSLWLLGDIIWFSYDLVLNREAPFPSPADVAYLSAYITFAVGAMAAVRVRASGANRASLTDGAIVAVGVGMLSWAFFMAPYAHDQSLTITQRIFAMAYPLMDVLVLTALARWLFVPGPRTASFYLLIVGVATFLIADVNYALTAPTGIYQEGSWVDTGWLLGYVLWGASALHPSMRRVAEATGVTTTNVTRLRLGVLASVSVLGPLVFLVQSMREQQVDVPVLVGGSITLFLLALARVSGIREIESNVAQLTAQKEELARSEARYRRLFETATDLVITISADGVVTSLNPAVERVIGRPLEQIIGKHFQEIVHAGDRVLASKALQQLPPGKHHR